MADAKTTVRAGVTSIDSYRERRRTVRISVPFPIQVCGFSAAGEPQQFDTTLENLSAGGLYLRTAQDMRAWQRIMIHIRLGLAADPAGRVPVVAARVTILRTDPQPGQPFGFAIAFRGYRIQ